MERDYKEEIGQHKMDLDNHRKEKIETELSKSKERAEKSIYNKN